MAKMSIMFNGFTDLAEAIDKAQGDLHGAVDEALNKTFQIVKDHLIPAAAVYDRKGLKGYATGKMYRAILKDSAVEWEGNVATVKVGFTSNGGATLAGFMHSIFVMYGTPKMAKDPKIYNAIKGRQARVAIAMAQEEILQKYLKLAGG